MDVFEIMKQRRSIRSNCSETLVPSPSEVGTSSSLFAQQVLLASTLYLKIPKVMTRTSEKMKEQQPMFLY